MTEAQAHLFIRGLYMEKSMLISWLRSASTCFSYMQNTKSIARCASVQADQRPCVASIPFILFLYHLGSFFGCKGVFGQTWTQRPRQVLSPRASIYNVRSLFEFHCRIIFGVLRNRKNNMPPKATRQLAATGTEATSGQ